MEGMSYFSERILNKLSKEGYEIIIINDRLGGKMNPDVNHIRPSVSAVEFKCINCNAKDIFFRTNKEIWDYDNNNPSITQPCKKCGGFTKWIKENGSKGSSDMLIESTSKAKDKEFIEFLDNQNKMIDKEIKIAEDKDNSNAQQSILIYSIWKIQNNKKLKELKQKLEEK